MKKIKFSALILAVILIFSFAGCKSNQTSDDSNAKKLNIVCTTFPSYDWVRNILGQKANDAKLTLLLDSGVDLHNYQATADDIVAIHSCDLFVYIGGASDEWVEDVTTEAANDKMVSVNLMQVLGSAVKEEETVEGMEEEEEEEEEDELDEHVWLSLKNAQVLVSALADALCEIDPESKEIYTANAEAYNKKLAALDEQYSAAVKEAEFSTLLFGDRFPFRYLVDDYGLSYYAAFAGCSAETEASFETVKFLADKVDELQLKHVMKIDGSDGEIAATISRTAKAETDILTMNSMQSVSKTELDAGATYLGIMEENLAALKQALN